MAGTPLDSFLQQLDRATNKALQLLSESSEPIRHAFYPLWFETSDILDNLSDLESESFVLKLPSTLASFQLQLSAKEESYINLSRIALKMALESDEVESYFIRAIEGETF